MLPVTSSTHLHSMRKFLLFLLTFWSYLHCRQCSSGLQAIAHVAAAIKAGYYTVGLAGGVETMSLNGMSWEGGVNPKVEMSQKAQSCLLPMGITSENVAAKFGLSRCVPGPRAPPRRLNGCFTSRQASCDCCCWCSSYL